MIAMCDETGKFQTQLSEGYTAWELRTEGQGESDPASVAHYGTIESLSIVHLAAEAFLRMYLAHSEHDPCPPLRLAALTSFRVFKGKCTDLRENPPSLEQVRAVFRGTSIGPDGLSPSEWDDDGETLLFLLSRAASIVLDDAASYNATKHGLAARPAESGLQIGKQPDQPDKWLFTLESHSVRYLVRGAGNPATGVAWEDRTTFVSAGHNALVASILADQIDSLHSVARARLYGERTEVALLSRMLRERLEAPPFGEGASGVLSLTMTRKFTLRSSWSLLIRSQSVVEHREATPCAARLSVVGASAYQRSTQDSVAHVLRCMRLKQRDATRRLLLSAESRDFIPLPSEIALSTSRATKLSTLED